MTETKKRKTQEDVSSMIEVNVRDGEWIDSSGD